MDKTEQKNQLFINRIWCKGCGICVAFCPKEVLELDEDDKVFAVRREDCIYCGMCELRCPDFAVTVVKGDGKKGGKKDAEGEKV